MEEKEKSTTLDRSALPKLALSLALLSLLLLSTATPYVHAASAGNLVAPKTQHRPTVDGIPNEPFWSGIPATKASLTATTPYGGHITSMWIRVAHNSTHVFVLLQWADSTQSRHESAGKRLTQSTPTNMSGSFFYNSTYFYPDAAQVNWWMGNAEPTVQTAAVDHFGPSPTRRASLYGWTASDSAESWIFKAHVLDIGNPHWPDMGLDEGGTKYHWGATAGLPIVVPHSSLYHTLYNSSGNFAFGDGLIHAKSCQQPGTSAFEVTSRGLYSDGVWTLELSRALVPSSQNRPYTVTFAEGSTYWFSVAAFDGNLGENEEVGSKSDWFSVELSTQLVSLEQESQDAQSTANDALNAANDALNTANDAKQTASQAQTAASDASQVAGDVQKVAGDSQRAANDAANTAKNAQQAADDASNQAQQALSISQDAKSAIERANITAYAAIGIAVVSILLAIVMGLRKKP